MPIIIQNISNRVGIKHTTGKQLYRIMINDKLITVFRHDRDAGLASCLRAAADKVDEVEGKR